MREPVNAGGAPLRPGKGERQGLGVKFFTGQYTNKIDAKGRISVPAPFRAVVQARGLAGVALYPSLTHPCIEGCGMDQIDKWAEDQPDNPLPSAREEAISHLIIGAAREALFDGGGRIVLPEDFMAKARLTDQGAFVGQGRRFQIWEPRALADAQAAMAQRLFAAARGREGGGS
jgi:MraZ protein